MKKELQKAETLDGYEQLLIDVRSILENGRIGAYKAVDNLRVQTYWQIGDRVVREELKHKDRADYGKRVIEYLARDLGFLRRLMFRIVQFYRAYPIVSTLSTQLSWSHYMEFITVKNEEERRFYEVQTIKNSWDVRGLRKRIAQQEYEKAKKEGKLDFSLPKELPAPEEIFKNAYHFDYLCLEAGHSEKELETGLIRNIRDTLLEFGFGFCFMGQQVKLLIAGQFHNIDILFYHRDLQCIIVAELKKGKFRSEYVGQMNKYLNYLKEKDKREWERDPIGLIICKEKDDEEVHYALGGLEDKIFVAEYKTKLPTEEEITARLQNIDWRKDDQD
jgi:predicted nuclease of restriction endonuclease-like (RecB) superfamily